MSNVFKIVYKASSTVNLTIVGVNAADVSSNKTITTGSINNNLSISYLDTSDKDDTEIWISGNMGDGVIFTNGNIADIKQYGNLKIFMGDSNVNDAELQKYFRYGAIGGPWTATDSLNLANFTSLDYFFYCSPGTTDDVDISIDFSKWIIPNVTSAIGMFENRGNMIGTGISTLNTTSLTNITSTFKGCSNYTGAGLDTWDTREVTVMTDLFNGCAAMDADLSWNTSKVTDLTNTFKGCVNYTGTGLDAWDTAEVTVMTDLFNGCAFMDADLSWNTSKVTDLKNTFKGCSNYTGAGLDTWDTSGVTVMTDLFNGCAVMNADLSSWNIANVTDLSGTFKDCVNYTGAGLYTWDTSGVTVMTDLFNGCASMNADLSWNTSKVTDLTNTFKDCVNYTGAGLDAWDTSGVTVMTDLFNGCAAMNADLSSWNTSKVTDLTNTFKGCVNYTGTGLYTWDTAEVTVMTDLFNGCASMNAVLSWNTSKVTDLSGTFKGCVNYTGAGLDAWDTSGVTVMTDLFNGCAAMNADLSWNTSKVTDLTNTFKGCVNYTGTGLDTWDTSGVTVMTDLFNGCAVMDADLSWNTSKVTDLTNTFKGCVSYTGTGLYTWDTAEVTVMTDLFNGCAVMNADLSSWNIANVTDLSGTFKDCVNYTGAGLDKWVITNVTNMNYLFSGNNHDKMIGWDTSKVVSMNGTFYNVGVSLDLTNWVGPSTETISYMLSSQLGPTGPIFTGLDSWDVSEITDMEYLFYGLSNLDTSMIRSWDVGKVHNMASMFDSVLPVETMDLSGWNVGNVRNMDRMFNLTLTDVQSGSLYNWDTRNVTSMASTFLGTTVRPNNVENWITTSVTNMAGLFNTCALHCDLSMWNTSNVENMDYMFQVISQIKEMSIAINKHIYDTDIPAGISDWDTKRVTSMVSMFRGNGSMEHDVTGNWDRSSLTNIKGMFAECVSLTDISIWDVGNVTDMAYLFYGCNNFVGNQSINEWDTGKVKYMQGLFANCSGDIVIDISSWDVTEARNIHGINTNVDIISNIDEWNPMNVDTSLEEDMAYQTYQDNLNYELGVSLTDFGTSNDKWVVKSNMTSYWEDVLDLSIGYKFIPYSKSGYKQLVRSIILNRRNFITSAINRWNA